MLVDFGNFILRILNSSWNMLNSSSGWMIFSFIVAGVLHEFLKPEKVQKTAIGSSRVSGVFGPRYQECLYRSAAVVRFRLESACIIAARIWDLRLHL